MAGQAKDWREVAEQLADIARDLFLQDSVPTTLDRIAECAVELIEGCEAAGILVVAPDEVVTLAATDEVARASDRLQGELREGPCFDASRLRQRVHRIEDLTRVDARWSRYAPRATELGIGSVMSFLLFTTGHDNLGTLNLYSPTPGVFTDLSEQVGLLLAAHAAVALAAAQQDARLHEALDTSRMIGEAMGILMAEGKIGSEQAFELLRRVSMNTNVKLRDVAKTLVTTGTLPTKRR